MIFKCIKCTARNPLSFCLLLGADAESLIATNVMKNTWSLIFVFRADYRINVQFYTNSSFFYVN
jgi:hypothetical protein